MKNAHDWINTNEYPFRLHNINLDGIKMNYIDEGEGDIMLFVHGTPSWSFEYRNIIKTFSLHYRCIAIDHIGFGLSDKPRQYNYSLEQHSKNLESFIEIMNLKNLILIVHDFGGPIGLDYTLKYPPNIKSIIFFNTWAWKLSGGFSRWILNSGLLRLLYTKMNISPRYLLPLSFGEKKLSKPILEQYCRPFGSSSERYGPLCFARSLVLEGKWFDQLWNGLPLISYIPTMFIWGMKDRFIKPLFLNKLSKVFLDPCIYKLETAGHFPHEEDAYLVSRLIRSFIISNTYHKQIQ